MRDITLYEQSPGDMYSPLSQTAPLLTSHTNDPSPTPHPPLHALTHAPIPKILTRLEFSCRKSTSFFRNSWGSIMRSMPNLASWSSKAWNMQFPSPGMSSRSWKHFCWAFSSNSFLPVSVFILADFLTCSRVSHVSTTDERFSIKSS